MLLNLGKDIKEDGANRKIRYIGIKLNEKDSKLKLAEEVEKLGIIHSINKIIIMMLVSLLSY